MKFTFNYTVKPHYYHELIGISKDWDIQVQKLIFRVRPKDRFCGIGRLVE